MATICLHCNSPINPGQAFCHACGRPLGAQAWKTPLRPPGDDAPRVPSYIEAQRPTRYADTAPYSGPRRADGGAIASMILGIIGLVAVPIIASIIALALGYPARRRIQDSRDLDGDGFATAGIVTGWIGVVGGIIFLIAIAAVVSSGPEIVSDFGDPGGGLFIP